ncbi:MAG: TonB-dependent receptor [Nitrospirota bacterium]
MNLLSRGLFIPAVLLIIEILMPRFAFAGECEKWVAKVASVQGTVEARRVDETQWKSVRLRNTYCPGDTIRVMGRSRAVVVLFNDAALHLDQNTTITLAGPETETTFLIELLNGVAYFFSRQPRSLKVITPFVNAAVEGTEFLINLDKDKASMTVFKGAVSGTNKEGSITLTSGESAIAEKGKAPQSYLVAKPRDQVQWALHYPPVVYEYPEKLKDSDPRFYLYRASALLQVGRIDEAEAAIEKALVLDRNNSMALALQSIIAVAQNEKEKALDLAAKAVQADPESASAHVALSYAYQANFNLNGALNSLKEAVKVEPENALAWARLSEMWLSFGNLDEALKAADKAVALNSHIARTQTVLGFAYLTQVKINGSKEAFEKAIELDQADPLPRLGLGLAKIRVGCLKDGRQEIEIAAALDTGNSIIRSYLGKSYYEEKRDKQAGEELSIAEELDPMDPTPFFYNAIRKQSINRPVEALHDMEKAIELNDNRAIYRSELLLDQDLAARSASLARIYSDLGFEQLALVEGWKSVNTDPANFSAHRFLADSYSILPRHEIARVSELLQSQLLQPINMTPIQPHLAEGNLFILEGAGPADLSFNEFNPLFTRNRISFQLNGIAGGNNTFGDEIVVSAIQGKASLSAGQFHYETDGWRENSDQKQDIYDLFAQIALSAKTSVQAEFRERNIVRGDLSLNFFEDFLTNLRSTNESRTLRIGFHHAFSPGSDLIGSFKYNNAEDAIHDVSLGGIFDYKKDQDNYGGELQYQFKSERFSVVTGAGILKRDFETITSNEIIDPPIKLIDVQDGEVRYNNLYLYSYLRFLKNLTITAGGSADFFDSDTSDEDRFNPKFGLIWNISADTTFRAAIIKTFYKPLIDKQTIEPTQVAGFNQFFDDAEGTESWRYGVAVDQKFSYNIYGGVEYSWRNLKVPYMFFPVPEAPPPGSDTPPDQAPPPPPAMPVAEMREVDWDEQLGRVYMFWTPHDWVSLSAEYQFERFDRDKEFVAGIEEVKTHRIPLGVNLSHPSGISVKLSATYFKQEGKFLPQLSDPPSIPGSDRFWIVDAAVSYRLPKRFGLVTVGATNLLNKSFRYQDTDPVNPSIQPDRFIFARATFAL